MKKILSVLLISVLVLSLTACSPKPELRSYVYESDENELSAPCVTLQEDNKFSFVFSLLSSYIGFGTYEIDGDTLICRTDDGDFVYVFEIGEDKLIFDAKKSSEMTWFADIPDGAEFK